jgi:hypothetical protein
MNKYASIFWLIFVNLLWVLEGLLLGQSLITADVVGRVSAVIISLYAISKFSVKSFLLLVISLAIYFYSEFNWRMFEFGIKWRFEHSKKYIERLAGDDNGGIINKGHGGIDVFVECCSAVPNVTSYNYTPSYGVDKFVISRHYANGRRMLVIDGYRFSYGPVIWSPNGPVNIK